MQEPQFPIELLPQGVRQYCHDLNRYRHVSLDILGPVVLAVTSAALGKGLVCQGLRDSLTRPNLYVLIGADTGAGKDLAFESLAKPFVDYDKWRRAGQRAQMDEKAKALVCENVTSEALALTLAANGGDECLWSASSDARAVIDIMLGRYTDHGSFTDESLYLKGYSWGRASFFRVTRPPVELYEPCIGILWLTQPDKLRDMYATKGFLRSGLVSRFLTCVVEPADALEPETCPQTHPHCADWSVFVTRLIERFRLDGRQARIGLTPDAYRRLAVHANGIYQRSDLELIRNFVVRWTENAARLALILHVLDHGTDAANYPVAQDAVDRAIAMQDWFAEHQLFLTRGAIEAIVGKASRVAIDLLQRKKEMTARNLLQCSRTVATANEARMVMDQLVELGIAEAHEGPRTRYYKWSGNRRR